MNWMTRRMLFSTAAISCSAFLFACAGRPIGAQALPETVEAIHKARVSTRILFITAHPDDEWSSLLAYLSHGLNADVALLTITRGQGGQNAIGPEQDGELGVVRTEELLAAGRYYGVQQYFTRALDTGYLKSPDQAMKVWGNLALEDMVRVIRTYRPDVVINGWGGTHSGHGHHQASGILTPQAVAAAADPKMFPEQIAEGLPAWKVTLEARVARNGNATNAVELPANKVSPLWGKTYVEIGMEGHAQHRSQGTPAFFGNAFFRRPVFLAAENEKGEAGKFNTQLLAEPLHVAGRAISGSANDDGSGVERRGAGIGVGCKVRAGTGSRGSGEVAGSCGERSCGIARAIGKADGRRRQGCSVGIGRRAQAD